MAYTPDEFAVVLMGAAVEAAQETAKVVSKGALNVKNDARRNVLMTAPVQNAHAYKDISYDLDSQGATISAEIGYETGPGKAGNLGNLLEFGGKGDHSPPHHDLRFALEAEEPGFVRALEDVVEQAIK